MIKNPRNLLWIVLLCLALLLIPLLLSWRGS